MLSELDAHGPSGPSPNTWVYLRQGSTLTVLRSDANGRLKRLASSGTRDHAWTYTDTFTIDVPSSVGVFSSRGAKPLPDAVLQANGDVLIAQTLSPPAQPVPSPTPHPAPPDTTTTIVVTPVAVVTVREPAIAISAPTDLSLWPLLFEPLGAYLTDGLLQGVDAFDHWAESHPGPLPLAPQSGCVLVPHGTEVSNEGQQAPAPSESARLRPRGLAVRGMVQSGIDRLKLQAFDASGARLQLRETPSASPSLERSVTTTGGAFAAPLYFGDASAALGPLSLVVKSDGLSPPTLSMASVQLVALQQILVDDYVAEQSGQQAGPISAEADDKIIVDFIDSPQSSGTTGTLVEQCLQAIELLKPQWRVRRMAVYHIHITRTRPASGSSDLFLQPEMPLFMAETHLLGATREQLEELLICRQHLVAGAPARLRIGLTPSLHLHWNGPDHGPNGPTPEREFHSDLTTFAVRTAEGYAHPAELFADLALDTDGRLTADSDHALADSLTPAPAAMPFPVDGRRLPRVRIDQRRAWGRHAGAPTGTGVVIEWQPAIVAPVTAADEEVLRGGNLDLTTSVTIDGARVDAGYCWQGQHVVATEPTAPDIFVPTARVIGDNPSDSDALQVIDAMVVSVYNAHQTACVRFLPLALWQSTMRLILHNESGYHQFIDFPGTAAPRYHWSDHGHTRQIYHGIEGGTVKFGAPHGYGMVQADPHPPENALWNYFLNLRFGVELLLLGKAGAALHHFAAHPLDSSSLRDRAIFRRECVRRYNTGYEFVWSDGRWAMQPSGGNPGYVNNVLGTTTHYHPAGTTPFASADYGADMQ